MNLIVSQKQKIIGFLIIFETYKNIYINKDIKDDDEL